MLFGDEYESAMSVMCEDDVGAFATNRTAFRRVRKRRVAHTTPCDTSDAQILDARAIETEDRCVGTTSPPPGEICAICCEESTDMHHCALSPDHTSCVTCFESTIRSKFDASSLSYLPGCCWSPGCAATITPGQLMADCSAKTRVAPSLRYDTERHDVQRSGGRRLSPRV